MDGEGETPGYLDKDHYHAEVTWRRQLHQQHHTALIELCHGDLASSQLELRLADQLTARGISINRPDSADFLESLVDSGAITRLSALLLPLISQLKAAGLTPEATRRQDHRSPQRGTASGQHKHCYCHCLRHTRPIYAGAMKSILTT